MKKLYIILLLSFSFNAYSQNEIVNNIVEEAENNSQLESLAHELLDLIGPRLVGTPQMKNAHDWAIEKYKSWGIDASLHQFGEMEWLGKRYYPYRYDST